MMKSSRRKHWHCSEGSHSEKRCLLSPIYSGRRLEAFFEKRFGWAVLIKLLPKAHSFTWKTAICRHIHLQCCFTRLSRLRLHIIEAFTIACMWPSLCNPVRL